MIELFTYGLAMRVMPSMLIALVFSFLEQRYEAMTFLQVILPAVFIGSLCCEWMVASLLRLMAKPLGVQTEDVGRFWRGLCYCLSSYLLSSFVLLGVMALLPKTTWRIPGYIDESMGYLIPLIAIGWWWHSLGQAIRKRALPSIGRTLMPLIVAPVALLAIIIGHVCAWLCDGIRHF
jgi:hypothetical protein